MTITCNHPLPPEWTVRKARDVYLEENGFTVAGYDAPRTEGAFLRVRFSVPNTPRHHWAIMRHDLHHVATGYGTDMRGEAEISGWELRGGIRSLGLYTGSIVLSGALYGLLLTPIRTWQAFRANAKRSLFGKDVECRYEELLDLTVRQLRQRLGIPAMGLNTRRRGLSSLAPQ